MDGRFRRRAPIGRRGEGRGGAAHGYRSAAAGGRPELGDAGGSGDLAARERGADGGAGGGPDPRAAGWGIAAGLDPEMALLAEHLLRPLPADNQIETGPFLEAVAHLPPFFGERPDL